VFNYLNYEPDAELIEMTKGGGGAPGFFLENNIPIPTIEWNSKPSASTLAIKVENPQKKVYPYGIFLWESKYKGITKYFQQKRKIPKEISIKISPDQGIFLRINLKSGLNNFNIE